MARRGCTTPTDDAQLSLDFLWRAGDNPDEHSDAHQGDQHQAEESNDRRRDH